jgi:hypothetical protein
MCRNNETEMFRFETANFIVRATIQPDNDVDTSFDETGETDAKLSSGEYQSFGTIVRVATRDGIELGCDSLWGSIYANPRDFFADHRNSDAMNRNSSIMRAAQGENVAICHYFPDMVREAIRDARKTLTNMPKLREVTL